MLMTIAALLKPSQCKHARLSRCLRLRHRRHHTT
jgi:hypothetical protein